jgi:hypothetical protein
MNITAPVPDTVIHSRQVKLAADATPAATQINKDDVVDQMLIPVLRCMLQQARRQPVLQSL